MRLQPEVNELGVLCIVVVLLGLHARIRQMIDLDIHSQLSAGGFNLACQIQDGKLLRKLVVHATLAGPCWIVARDFDATYRVANVEESARLATLAVNG